MTSASREIDFGAALRARAISVFRSYQILVNRGHARIQVLSPAPGPAIRTQLDNQREACQCDRIDYLSVYLIFSLDTAALIRRCRGSVRPDN